MNIDICLLGALIRQGFSNFYEQGVTAQMIEDGGARLAFNFIEDHWKQYQSLPQVETIKFETGVDVFSESAIEPVEFWCKKIKERALYEELNSGLREIAGHMQKSQPDNAFASMQALVYRVGANIVTADRPRSIFSNLPEMMADYEKAKLGIYGVPSPWPSMNEATRGWQPGDFALFAAKAGVGKTWSLLIMSSLAWRQGFKILLVSTEMPPKALQRRLYSLITNQSYTQIRTGTLDAAQEKAYKDRLFDKRDDSRLIVMGGGFGVSVSSIEAAIIEHKPDLVCIDGIYHIKVSGRFEKTYENHSEIFTQTKELAMRRQVPILASSQLNNQYSKVESKEPDLSSLAYTATAGRISDYVFFLAQTRDMRSARELEIEPVKIREADYMKPLLINWRFDIHDFSEKTGEKLDVDAPAKSLGGSVFRKNYNVIPDDDPW